MPQIKVKSAEVAAHENTSKSEVVTALRKGMEEKLAPPERIEMAAKLQERLVSEFLDALHKKYDAECSKLDEFKRPIYKLDSTAVADLEYQAMQQVLKSEETRLKAVGLTEKELKAALKYREESLEAYTQKLHEKYAADYLKTLRTDQNLYG